MAEKKGFFAEFKAFAMRGNVIDLAVGMIIGSAFGKITSSLVNDVIMPAVSILLGGISFNDWKLVLKEAVMAADGTTVEAAEVAVKYGTLISTVVDFIILAFCIFCMVKAINTVREKAESRKKAEEAAAAAAAEAAAAAQPAAPTTEQLLGEILEELKKK